MICSYCKTETLNIETCDFCKADLIKERPQMRENLDDSVINYEQPQLEKLHTYDLLKILRYVRAKRTEEYKNMQIIRKASKGSFQELEDLEINSYIEITAKKNILEEILIDRMGYFPQRVDDKLLKAFNYKINKVKKN